ncbi:MAG: Rieske 2Fe-2S domain-containing protein [Chloroflexi bacterium]|nr:Rieske 2Fe-2S domain-containing protein [Chloroflexota bacterium]
MLTHEQNELITRVGPGTPMGAVLREYWMPAVMSDEVAADRDPLRVRLLGEDLIAFRDTQGQVGLIQNNCPHRGASLFFGRNEEDGLRCVYHGWKFDVAGRCVDMPNEPAESNFKTKVRARAYPTRERNGVVWAYMGPRSSPPDLPAIEWNVLPADQVYITKRVQECNWAQALEGGIDPSHSGFLHAPLHVDLANASPRERYRLEKNPRFFLLDTPYGLRIGARRNAGADAHFWSVTHFLMPFYNAFSGGGGNEGKPSVGGFGWVPMDDERSIAWCFSWNPDRPLGDAEHGDNPRVAAGTHLPPSRRLPATTQPGGAFRPLANRSNDYELDREVQRTRRFFGVPGISGQDAAVQESMGRVVDRSIEHLGSSDSAVIRVRQLWLRAVNGHRNHGLTPQGVDAPESYRVRAAGFVIGKDEDWATAANGWITAQPGAAAPTFA